MKRRGSSFGGSAAILFPALGRIIQPAFAVTAADQDPPIARFILSGSARERESALDFVLFQRRITRIIQDLNIGLLIPIIFILTGLQYFLFVYIYSYRTWFVSSFF